MSLSKENITKIAKLARIHVEESEKDYLVGQLNGILKWIEQLQEVNTDGVPQLLSVSAMKLPWREDVVSDGGIQEKVLKNAPQSDYGCFVVPKVIDQG
jgi:aspartyl-tRNA(Asn)/glutamyl-tRNA(Gln) amidotransferase subunit C